MSRIKWGPEEQKIENGIDHGVLYLISGETVSWSGLLSVIEKPKVNNQTVKYLDGNKLVNKLGVEHFSASIEAFTYPEELEINPSFLAFSYRTKISDTNHRIHLVYNPVLIFDNRAYNSIGYDVELTTFTIELTSTPLDINGYAPTSHLILDIFGLETQFIEHFENKLYGSLLEQPALLYPNDILAIASELATATIFIIIDNGDGSWTAIGPDNMITMLDSTSFEIDSPSAVIIDVDSYTLSSM